jgi:hypothetical protein
MEGARAIMKASPSEDQRKSPRIDLHLGVMVRDQQGVKEVRNFGLYGIFVQTEDPSQFKTGDEIYLVMKLPPENRPLELKSRVAHVSEKGIGIEFVDLPPIDAMSMEFCFNVFKHTTPLPGT